jgi:hypothetical protein
MNDLPIYIIVVSTILLAIYGVYFLFSKHIEKQSKSIQNIKLILETHGKLYEEGMFLSYTYQDQTYSVQIIKVEKYAKFQFNSRVIWEKRVGQKKFYTNQTVFSKMPNKKIVIIYPNEGPFTYHYDESEIRFTSPKERIWDMYVIPMHQLEATLKEGL